MAGLIVKPRSRIYHGHDWVYASEVLKMFGVPKDGDVISLRGTADQLLGSAIYNSRSQIVARRFCRHQQELDPEFFERRIAQALEYRRRRKVDERLCRMVWSESDGLPGVIVDRYGGCLALQTLTAAMDQRRELIADALTTILAPTAIIERNDTLIRKAEGLELRTGVLRGEVPAQLALMVGGVEFELDLLHGQKTGFYLDQLANYSLVAAEARGRRVLDCFANAGGFALACARAGANSVTAIEISAEGVEQLKRNAVRNALAVDAQLGNAFDLLKDLERQHATYDLIVLDPPSFTKSKGRLAEAERGYKEIHLRALRLLDKDGLLATFCCSHHVSAEHFKQIVSDACVDAKKSVRQLAIYGQGLDHPVIPTLPETEYLKGFLFELMPGR